MKIIYGKENAEILDDKYLVFELDTFKVINDEVTAYCVISADEVALQQLPDMEHWKKFHSEFIHGYKTQQFGYCKDCLTNLKKRIGPEMDSYYDIMATRIDSHIEQGFQDDWSYIIQK